MPVRYTVSDHGSFVEFIATGRVVGDDVVRCKLDMSKDQAIAPSYSELCDLTGVTSVEVEPDFIQRIAEASRVNQEAHYNTRAAVVVSRPDLFDLARQYERTVASIGITVIVFNHRDTALLWLGRNRRMPERPMDRPNVRPQPPASRPETHAPHGPHTPGRDQDRRDDGPRSQRHAPPNYF